MVRYVFFKAYHVLFLWISYIIRYDVILFKDRSEKLEAYVDRLYEAWVALLSSPISFTLCLFQDGVIVKGVASYHCIFIIFNIVIIITPLGLASTLYIQHGIKIIDCAIVIKSSRSSSSTALHSVCPLSISKMDVGLAVT